MRNKTKLKTVLQAKKDIEAGLSPVKIAKKNNLPVTTVYRIINKESYNFEKPDISGNWKSFIEGENFYWISDAGQIFSCRFRRLLIGAVDKDGYLIFNLAGKNAKAHRLVLTIFKRKPRPGEVCRHLDDNPLNNNLWNICWGTQSQNEKDKRKKGIKHTGCKHKLSIQDEFVIRNSSKDNKFLAKFYKVSTTTIRRIKKRCRV